MKRIYATRFKVLFILIQMFCVLFMVNAQDAMQADTLRQVDVAFFQHSPEMLGNVLAQNRKAFN